MNRVILGKNRAILKKSIFESAETGNKRCIFLSHATVDKDAVREIGDYIMKAGIDIYLDESDSNLQAAVTSGDNDAITKCIENGLSVSTDILCVVSESTKLSWWVPYEVGYGKKSSAKVSTILLENVTTIPSFLLVTNLLRDIWDLNRFLDNLLSTELSVLTETSTYNLTKSASALKYDAKNHPLAKYVKTVVTN